MLDMFVKTELMYTPSSLWLVVVSSISPLLVRISIWSRESIFVCSLVPVSNMDFDIKIVCDK